MSEPAKSELPASGERLTLEEIDRLYPNEWVVLVDIDWTGMVTRSGVVAAHCPGKKEAYAAAKELRASGIRMVGTFWTGRKMGPRGLWLLDEHVHKPV